MDKYKKFDPFKPNLMFELCIIIIISKMFKEKVVSDLLKLIINHLDEIDLSLSLNKMFDAPNYYEGNAEKSMEIHYKKYQRLKYNCGQLSNSEIYFRNKT